MGHGPYSSFEARKSAHLRMTGGALSSIHYDLDAIPRLDLGMRIESVEHAESLGRMMDAGHAVRQRFHGVAGLHGDDLDAQGTRGLDFIQRQAAERVDGLARIAIAFGGLLFGREDEAVDEI